MTPLAAYFLVWNILIDWKLRETIQHLSDVDSFSTGSLLEIQSATFRDLEQALDLAGNLDAGL